MEKGVRLIKARRKVYEIGIWKIRTITIHNKPGIISE